jgi:hypothetical protein
MRFPKIKNKLITLGTLFILLLFFSEKSISKNRQSGISLRTGTYYQQASKYITIFGSKGNYCYSGQSRNGSNLASLNRDSKNPNSYRIYGWGETSVMQLSKNILLFGNSEYIYDNNFDNKSNLSSDEKACLKSRGSYKKSSSIGIYGYNN